MIEMNGMTMDFSKLEKEKLVEMIDIKKTILELNTTAYNCKMSLNQLVLDNPQKANPVFEIEKTDKYINLFKKNLMNDMTIEKMRTEAELKQIEMQIEEMQNALDEKVIAEVVEK